MKYTSDQRGIMNRYLAEGNNWESHLEQTRSFIIKCLEKNEGESVAVLGSGWLLDTPIDYLCNRYKTVFLVDIVHSPQILNKAKKMKNVWLISADLTGGAIEGTYNFVRHYRKTGAGSVLDIPFQANLSGINADYVISLNILNQLDILLVDYISRFIKVPEEEIEVFRTRIQQQHLDMLPAGRSCLVSDIEERVLNRGNNLVSTRRLVYSNLPDGKDIEKWTWTFDTRGEYNRGCSTEMLVYATDC